MTLHVICFPLEGGGAGGTHKKSILCVNKNKANVRTVGWHNPENDDKNDPVDL